MGGRLAQDRVELLKRAESFRYIGMVRNVI